MRTGPADETGERERPGIPGKIHRGQGGNNEPATVHHSVAAISRNVLGDAARLDAVGARLRFLPTMVLRTANMGITQDHHGHGYTIDQEVTPGRATR